MDYFLTFIYSLFINATLYLILHNLFLIFNFIYFILILFLHALILIYYSV